MISLDVKEEVIRLRALDYSFDRIASTLNISKPKVVDICSEFNDEIETAKTIQKNTLIDDFAYSTEERSKLYRELIAKIHAEILSRDIKQVSTERLFTMLERVERSLSNLEPKTNYSSSQADFDGMSDEDLEKLISVSCNTLSHNHKKP
jgi:predicted DNA-binding protein YlxM (UPF0122 family)